MRPCMLSRLACALCTVPVSVSLHIVNLFQKLAPDRCYEFIAHRQFPRDVWFLFESVSAWPRVQCVHETLELHCPCLSLKDLHIRFGGY